jgi:hypothetical protein
MVQLGRGPFNALTRLRRGAAALMLHAEPFATRAACDIDPAPPEKPRGLGAARLICRPSLHVDSLRHARAAREVEKVIHLRAEQPTPGGPPMSGFERLGCEVNRMSIDDLFQRYMQTGFLYPDKLERLAPFTSEILDNWRRAAASPDELLRIVTYAGARERTWASLASWRHTESAWCTQHLVSRGDPFASRAVMLAELHAMIDDPRHRSSQNWFRPDNRLPQRVFGSIIEQLGPERACANLLTMFEVPLLAAGAGPAQISAVTASNQAELRSLATELRGQAFVTAEGLDEDDFELHRVDQAYRRVGLFRYRRGWLAHAGGELVAALVAHRGPLGLNYSFIENRADLLVAPACPPQQIVALARQLVAAASDSYGGFRPGYVPLFVDGRSAPWLAAAGLEPIRTYYQTIYLRSSYARYLDHIESTFARVAARVARQQRSAELRSLQPPSLQPPSLQPRSPQPLSTQPPSEVCALENT